MNEIYFTKKLNEHGEEFDPKPEDAVYNGEAELLSYAGESCKKLCEITAEEFGVFAGPVNGAVKFAK